MASAGPDDTAPSDQVAPDTKGGGPSACGECGGTGQVGAEPCEACGATGQVDETVGGAG